MEFIRVPSKTLIDRLDAGYYSPIYVDNAKKLEISGIPMVSIKSLTTKCNCGATPKQVSYDRIGQGLIRGSDVHPNEFLHGGILRTSDLKVDRKSNLAAYRGDLLFTMSGSIGHSVVIPPIDEVFSFSNTIARARFLKSTADAHFIATFLNSKIGFTQSKRLISGGIQGHVMPNPFKLLPVPQPSMEVQTYIGDKVRQAELLRARAQLTRKAIEHSFNDLFSGIHTIPVAKNWRIHSRELTHRINAEFYMLEYLEIERAIRSSFKSVVYLKDIATIVRKNSKPMARCCYREIGDIDIATGEFGSGTIYDKRKVPNNAQKQFRRNDVAISTRRPNRGAVAVVEDENPNDYYSIFLAQIRPKVPEFSYWLKEFLRHPYGRKLLEQRCTQKTYPVISEDDIGTIPIPIDQSRWSEISKYSQLARINEVLAQKLTTSARFLVESLIERKLTEAELIAAHNDPAADRALLSRLTVDGLDVANSPPLFPDLDRLQELLDQARRGEEQ